MPAAHKTRTPEQVRYYSELIQKRVQLIKETAISKRVRNQVNRLVKSGSPADRLYHMAVLKQMKAGHPTHFCSYDGCLNHRDAQFLCREHYMKIIYRREEVLQNEHHQTV